MAAENGAKVVIADMQAEAGEKLARDLGGRFAKTDVASEADGKAAVATALKEFGGLHVLVNCAGIALAERTLGKEAPHDLGRFERVLRVNLLGAAALAEALIDNVAKSERKVIAMMSSRLGSIAEASGMTLPYATSKAALNMLVKGLAATLAGRGVIVVALSPGWVRTEMGGAGAPLAPETAVAGLRKVIDALTPAESGKFLSYDGSTIPW
jgi:NAD(P)-dependent dehydrogenase (short-subunit alcohol dehydrogenase family)